MNEMNNKKLRALASGNSSNKEKGSSSGDLASQILTIETFDAVFHASRRISA
jgi:hypothetical protein